MESIGNLLFAADTPGTWTGPILLAIVIACLVVPFVLGALIANSLRMRDYGWKFGLILCVTALSCVIIGRIWDPVKKRFNFKLGVDLQGGVILIYEIEQSVKMADPSKDGSGSAGSNDSGDFSMPALIEALSRRINPSGTKEIVIRPYGDRQVELVIPEVDQVEVDQIKKTISTAGVLQFRIVANSRDHADIIELAREATADPIKKRGRIIYDDSGTAVGLWARVGRETQEVQGVRPFKVAVGEYTVRDAFSGDFLSIPMDVVNNPADRTDDDRRLRLSKYIEERGLKEIDVLMETNDGLNVTGAHLGTVMQSVDELMNPCIHFTLKGIGVNLFGDLTETFKPEGNFHRQLGIVLDNELLSAPNIQERITERGRITGNFSEEEVQFLVNILQAGSLPVVLNKIPISESRISPLLGQETIEQGKYSMILGTVLVFLFMLVYYRFAGFLACIALALNILFTLALMVLIKAPLTLPGLAGLVLTVGMSVDANVLIYERIREELARGAALRMALRNGFARATTTIIDSNLTTILTAIVLYAIGTDQLRGFAVLLTLGLITSMFTAIFCARVFFDVVERTRFLTTLKMFQFLPVTNIDFIKYRHWAIGSSVIIMAIGLGAAIVRGRDLLDIDFTGGSSVHMMLEKPEETDRVRKLLDERFHALNIPYSLTGMNLTPGQSVNRIFKVDAKTENVEELEKIIQESLAQSGGAVQLATYSLSYSNLRDVTVTTPTSGAAANAASDASRDVEGKKDLAEPVLEKATSEKTEPATKSNDQAPSPEKAAPPTEPAGKDDTSKDSSIKDSPAKEATPESKTDSKDSSETKAGPEKKDSEAKDASEPKKDSQSDKEADSKKDSTPEKEKETESTSEGEPKKDGEKSSDSASLDVAEDNLVALATFALQEEDPTKTEEKKTEDKKADSSKSDEKKSDESRSDEQQAPEKKADDSQAEEKKADENKTVDAKADETKADDKKSDDKKSDEKKTESPAPGATAPSATAPPATSAGPPAEGTPGAPPSAPGSTTTLAVVDLKFGHAINAPTLRAEIEETAQKIGIPLSYFDLQNPAWDGIGSNSYDTWSLRLATSQENAKRILDELTQKFASEPVWPSSSTVGPMVAGRMQRMAIMALIASWIGIIAYVWFRFQNLVFGLAAVLALVHDVLITVAAMAVSYWLAGPLSFLLVEDFKISLTIIAALLTIIGFSINDTIVIFDRIREVRGKSPDITANMVNLSVNQTLGRTLLTFFTVFIVVVCLYVLGGQGIHGFAFAMLIGLLSGTYSTVFIATPFVLWLAGKRIETPAPKPMGVPEKSLR